MSTPVVPDEIQSDIEAWLAAIAGVTGVELPVPDDRIQKWLAVILDQITSGGSGNFITDEVTGKRYKLGMNNGKLFVEEVVI